MCCVTTCEMAPHQSHSRVGNVASIKSCSICLLVAFLLSNGPLVACWNQGNDGYLGRHSAGYGGYQSEEQQRVSVHGGNSGGFERGSQLGAPFQGQTAGGAVTDLQRHQWSNGATGSGFATPGIVGGDTQQQQLNGFNGAGDYNRGFGVPAHGGSYQGVNHLGHAASGATAPGATSGHSAVPGQHTTAGDSHLAGSYAGATAGAGSAGFNNRATAPVYPGGAVGGYAGRPVTVFPHPWKFGPPSTVGGGFGRPSFPWYGPTGYLYRPPVAHLNPDGSYSFSYNTPHSNRDETGDGSGNVAGTYGFQNDGAKHNFSFNAGPDVDLRTNFVQSGGADGRRTGIDNPINYDPQSVNNRGVLPLAPGGGFVAPASPGGGSPLATNGFSDAGAPDGLGSGDGSDQSSLSVIGLPTPSGSDSSDVTPNLVQTRATEANLARDETTTNQPAVDTARNTIIDRTAGQQGAVDRTLPNNQPDGSRVPGTAQYGANANRNGPASDFATNFGAGNGGFEPPNNPAGVSSFTTPTPVSALGGEQAVGRPENDPSYNFNLQGAQGQGVPFGNDGAGWNGLPNGAGAGLGLRRPDGSFGAGGEGGAYPGFTPNSASGFGTGSYGQPQAGAFSPTGDLNSNNFQYNPSAIGQGFPVATAGGVPASGGFEGFNSNGGGANSFVGEVTNRAGGAAAGAGGRMYQFGYSTPDSVRQESADARGNVRGSFAYNNAAGRHDLQYVAGSGTGFRPTGGSLSIPNGLSGGANAGTQFRDGSTFGNTATQPGLTANDGRQFGFDGRLSPTNQGQSSNFGATRHAAVTRSPQTDRVPDAPYPVPDANAFNGSGDGASYEEGSGQFGSGDHIEQATVSNLSNFAQ
ncbi:spidroin-1-like [Anopheles aquasalis]|uniref:spidroin-1-like n=1 Tax=Anopheles aquasalis TaxID=42839 RepID=UPI00215B00C5|nr:spidroin-1-like [Anopheles aquasalis]